MKAKILILGLICLFIFAYCNSPADPEIKKALNPGPQHFAGETLIVQIYGNAYYSDVITIRWAVFVTNLTRYEAKIVQADKSIYYWDGDLYDTVEEMPALWTGTSYYDPPLVLPSNSQLTFPTAYLWEEYDFDIPHPGYLPNRVKVIFHMESEGQIYLLETELAGIIWV